MTPVEASPLVVTVFRYVWAFGALYVLVAEAVAIFGPWKGMSLSGHVWRWMDSGLGPRVIVAAFCVWLFFHFIWQGRIW